MFGFNAHGKSTELAHSQWGVARSSYGSRKAQWSQKLPNRFRFWILKDRGVRNLLGKLT